MTCRGVKSVLVPDIDECTSSVSNNCDQVCSNQVPFFSCECLPGYLLQDDVNCSGTLTTSVIL